TACRIGSPDTVLAAAAADAESSDTGTGSTHSALGAQCLDFGVHRLYGVQGVPNRFEVLRGHPGSEPSKLFCEDLKSGLILDAVRSSVSLCKKGQTHVSSTQDGIVRIANSGTLLHGR